MKLLPLYYEDLLSKMKKQKTKEIRLLIRVKLLFHAKHLNSWTAE